MKNGQLSGKLTIIAFILRRERSKRHTRIKKLAINNLKRVKVNSSGGKKINKRKSNASESKKNSRKCKSKRKRIV